MGKVKLRNVLLKCWEAEVEVDAVGEAEAMMSAEAVRRR